MNQPSLPPRDAREFDVAVFGASGYTGRLVAEYLAERYGPEVRWAMVGRNRAKLEQVRDEVARIAPRAAAAPIVIADSDDRASLDALVRRTRVVATTAGPFLKYGQQLAAACVAGATDYCDLTGEVPFVRTMIDAHHEEARRTGARLVPCSGYDSIPSDLGVRMLHEAARARGLRLASVKHLIGKVSGRFSASSIESGLVVMELGAHDPATRALVADPYALDPAGGARGLDTTDALTPRYDSDRGAWVAPFVMAGVNTRVVRRSNALLGYPYGRAFRYSEEMITGRGPVGALAASVLSAGGFAMNVGGRVGAFRGLFRRALPPAGTGPSRETRDKGFFNSHFIARTTRDDGGEGPALRGLVVGQKDPGYGETAKMLAESALCLARGEAEAREGGVLTPASCFGVAGIARLRAAGMTFEVESQA